MREKDDVMKEKIMQDILENYDGKLDINLIFRKALEYVADIIEFKEPNPEDLLEIAEEEKIAIDTHVFKRYNTGVTSPFGIGSFICETYDPGEKVFKCEFNEKEIIVGFSDGLEIADYTLTYRRSEEEIINIVTIDMILLF